MSKYLYYDALMQALVVSACKDIKKYNRQIQIAQDRIHMITGPCWELSKRKTQLQSALYEREKCFRFLRSDLVRDWYDIDPEYLINHMEEFKKIYGKNNDRRLFNGGTGKRTER